MVLCFEQMLRMAETRRISKAVLCGFLVVLCVSFTESKPATQEGPCIDCIQKGEEHAGTQDTSQNDDVTAGGAARPGDVEELMHQGNHVHSGATGESTNTQQQIQDPQKTQDTVNSQQHTQDAKNVPEHQQASENIQEPSRDSRNDQEHQQASENTQEHNQAPQDIPEQPRDSENVHEYPDDSPSVPEHQQEDLENYIASHQAFSDEEIQREETPQQEHGSNPQGDTNKAGVQQQGQGQYQGGKVEELVHGDSNVHDPSHHEKVKEGEGEGSKQQFGAVDVENLMHADKDAHGSEQGKADDAIKGQFQAGDVEQMVHGREGQGQGQGEGHVHDSDPDAKKGQGPYKVGDVDILGKDSLNVHDPKSRDQIASAGDVSALMGHGGGGGGKEHEEEKGGGSPTVADGEHLMHGDGGHDHDVKQLKFLKTKDDHAPAKDRFQDVHGLLMHDDDHDDKDRDETVRRGKTITYKDIMDLGLEEERLKGVDLKKLLQDNAEEYDDWQRDKNAVPGESPEGSFWEQVGELRRRYLSFGRNDGTAKDLTGSKLDPEQQRWVAGWKGEGEEEDVAGGEDSILHQMELLGNTAPKQDRHKHKHDEYHENGRDLTDL